MAHSPMCSVCGYGCKAGADASLLLLTKAFHIFTYAQFIHGYLSYVFLQPVNELCHSHAIFDMGFFHIFNFHIVLYGLHQRRWVHPVYYLIGTVKQSVDGIVHPAFFQQHLLIPESLHRVIHFIIWEYGNPYTLQIFPGSRTIVIIQIWICLAADYILIDKQIQLIHGQDYIRQHHRIIKDIVPADVQKPCNVIQCSQHMDGCMCLLHGLAHICDFIPAAFTCILFRQYPGRLCRQGRAVLPYPSNEILSIGNPDIPVLQHVFQVQTHGSIDHAAVKPKTAPGRKLVVQIFLNLRNAFVPHFHHGDR